MKARWTPEPWKNNVWRGQLSEITDTNGRGICSVVYCPEGIHNARLIAAAPELAESLRAVLRLAETIPLTPDTNGSEVAVILAAAREVLAKAGAA